MKKKLAILVVLIVAAVWALPKLIHPRLEAELTRSLGFPVKFDYLALRHGGAELNGLRFGDFLTAREVDCVLPWKRLSLHPERLVLKGVDMRLDSDVLRQFREKPKKQGGKPRDFPILFEDGRLRLWGVADISPLKGEWLPDGTLTLEHPQGGRWTLAQGKLSVDKASLVAVALWLGRTVPLDPNLTGSAWMAFGSPLKAQFTLPWGDISVDGSRWTSARFGPFTDAVVDVGVAGLKGSAKMGKDPLQGEASWATGEVIATTSAPHLQFGEVEMTKVASRFQQELHVTMGAITFRGLKLGSAELHIRFAPGMEGELRLGQPLSLEAAQRAGLAPSLGINLGGVSLKGVRLTGSPFAPKISPIF